MGQPLRRPAPAVGLRCSSASEKSAIPRFDDLGAPRARVLDQGGDRPVLSQVGSGEGVHTPLRRRRPVRASRVCGDEHCRLGGVAWPSGKPGTARRGRTTTSPALRTRLLNSLSTRISAVHQAWAGLGAAVPTGGSKTPLQTGPNDPPAAPTRAVSGGVKQPHCSGLHAQRCPGLKALPEILGSGRLWVVGRQRRRRLMGIGRRIAELYQAKVNAQRSRYPAPAPYRYG